MIFNVSAVIQANGYRCTLDFFEDDIKSLLDYDSKCPRVPILLSRGSVFAPKIPTLAFAGFYEGPYWPMVEMQARYTAQRWLQSDELQQRRPYEEPGRLLALRKAMSERSLFVPQYW